MDQGSDIYQYKSSFNQQEKEELEEDKKFEIKLSTIISPNKDQFKKSLVIQASYPKIIVEEQEEKDVVIELTDDDVKQ